MKRSLWLTLSLITVLGMCLGMAAPALAANIGLLKDVTPAAPNIYHIGDTITYVVTVTNSSPTNNMTINSVQDTFPDATTASLDPGVPYTLLPGQSKTYNPAWVANVAPPPNGTVVNTVTVSGFQVTSPPDQFTALVTKSSMVINSRLSVQKTVDFNGDTTFSESETFYAGSPATWKIVVTNTGVGIVSGITLSDSNAHNFGSPITLAAGASQTFTYATNPTSNFTNTVTVNGIDQLGAAVGPTTDSASVIVIAPQISIQKTVDFNSDSVYAENESNNAGSTASWKVVVTNTGLGAVSNINVTDTNAHNFGPPFALATSASQTFIYTTNPAADTTNTATAAGKDQLGGNVGPVTDNASVTVFAMGHVRAFKYNDANHDGACNSGDTPLSGWQFCINGVCKTTDSAGYTGYWDLTPGPYSLVETQQSGWTNSQPGGSPPSYSFNLGTNVQLTYNFGNYQPPTTTPPGTILVGGNIQTDQPMAMAEIWMTAAGIMALAGVAWRLARKRA